MTKLEREVQIHTRPTKPHSVCAILLVGEINPKAVLTMNHQEEPQEVVFYDAFCTPFDLDPNNPMCAQEAASAAVVERTAYIVGISEWRYIVSLAHDKGEVFYYYAVLREPIQAAPLIAHEEPDALPKNTVHTLKWLIPLALDDNVQKPLGMKGI